MCRQRLLVELQGGEVVFKEIINNRNDSCHVEQDIDTGLEPELLAVVVKGL